MKIVQHIVLILVSALVLPLNACKSGGNFTGRTYMPDMQYSRAWEAYMMSYDTALFQYSALKPVMGTVPRGVIPEDSILRNNESALKSYLMKYYYPNTNEGYEASSELKNPLPLTKENLARGKEVYTIYCKPCHGTDGDGNGQLMASGVYSGVPNYKDRLPTINDGKAFFSIAYGKGKMGAHNSQVSAEDIWRIVHYINTFAYGTPNMTPATTIPLIAGAPKSKHADSILLYSW